MDHTLGCGLLNDGNGFGKALLGLFLRVAFHRGSDFPDGFLDPGLDALVSCSFDVVLFGPFKG